MSVTKDYFKNGNKINFVFPIDGDCVNEHDGFLKDGKLFVKAKVKANDNADIYINNIKATKNGELFEADVEAVGYRNTVVAVDKNDSEAFAKVAVYKLDGASGGYRISVDDNIIFLWDINKNKDTYKSIFENPYLAVYKKAHDLYGATVHLNLFYAFDDMHDFKNKRGAFDLSMMTDKFKDEWIENSNWLRLSFHANTNHPDMPYKHTDRETISRDCEKVNREIIRFAGRETLSDMTTVHWGECTVEGMRGIRALGVKGAAGYFEFNPNGTTLVSYFYPDDLVRYVGERDFWVDTEEDIIYGRIDLVLNTLKLEDVAFTLDEIYKNPHRAGFMEVMIHEEYLYEDYDAYIPEFEEIVLTAAKWCVEHKLEGRTFGSVMFEKRNTVN